MTITLNGESRDVLPGTTVAELLGELDVLSKHVAVEVNLQLVPRAKHAEHRLRENDRLEVVTLVGGG
ncbi:MAG TPA: sulfur carrier protein ThiS [Pirellulales bacterium]|jgi:sulfur carrier protein|nr:sulfur carrier protein ThiS [Pirellulales bacterium]